MERVSPEQHASSTSESVWSSALAILPYLVAYAVFVTHVLENEVRPREALLLYGTMVAGMSVLLVCAARMALARKPHVSLATAAPFFWALLFGLAIGLWFDRGMPLGDLLLDSMTVGFGAGGGYYTWPMVVCAICGSVLLAGALAVRIRGVRWWKVAAILLVFLVVSVIANSLGTVEAAQIVAGIAGVPLLFAPVSMLAVGVLRRMGRQGTSMASVFLLAGYVLGIHSSAVWSVLGAHYRPPARPQIESGFMLVAAAGTTWLVWRLGREWQKMLALVIGTAAVGYCTPWYSTLFYWTQNFVPYELMVPVQAMLLVIWIVVPPLLRLPRRNPSSTQRDRVQGPQIV